MYDLRHTMYNTHDGPWQAGSAYVRCTMYDLESSRALRGNLAEQVRMDNADALPAGRTGNVVPVSQHARRPR